MPQLGRKAERKFVEFFTAHLRNDHTRRAYAHAAAQLSAWLEINGLSLAELEPPEPAAYIKSLQVEGKAPTTVKARLSALSNLCDYLASSGGLDIVVAAHRDVARGLAPALPIAASSWSVGSQGVQT